MINKLNNIVTMIFFYFTQNKNHKIMFTFYAEIVKPKPRFRFIEQKKRMREKLSSPS